MKKYTIDIIVPVYFEENNIEKVVAGIKKKVKTPHRILAVWQDKNDPTLPILKKLSKMYTNLVLVESTSGIGVVKALKEGFQKITSPIVAIMMADQSDDPSDIDKMVKKIDEGYDLVCASRYSNKGKRKGGPVMKGILSRIGCLALRAFSGIPTNDATNAFKCFRKSLLQEIKIQSVGGFELPLELTVKAYVLGKKITEVPTVWKERESGSSKFKLAQWFPQYLRWFYYAIAHAKKSLFIPFFFLLGIVALYFYHVRGLILNDEGLIVQAGQRIYHGEHLYKDFFFTYTPISAFMTALSINFIGETMFASRMVALVFSIMSAILLYKIAREIINDRILALVPSLVFIVWGPFHINFSWPVIYAVFFGLATCYFLLQGELVKREKFFFLAGIASGLVFMAKQNFGVAIVLTTIAYFIFLKPKEKLINVVWFGVGNIIIFFAFLLYLFSTGTFSGAIENFSFLFLQKFVLEGVDATPFIYYDGFLKTAVKTMFYLFPAIISFIATLFLLKKKKQYTFLAAFPLFYYLLGIRPVTDYVHLTPLLALTGLPIFLTLTYMKNVQMKILMAIGILLFVSFGFYSATFIGYYRWEKPLIEQDHSLVSQGIFVDSDTKKTLSDLQKYVDVKIPKNESIFINYNVPSLYLILNRKNPTRFIYLSPNVVDYKYQLEIINDLEREKVRLVIGSSLLRNDKSYLTSYIQKNYALDTSMHNFDLWLKK